MRGHNTTLTIHQISGADIAQRADGYVNATAMCKAHGKKLNHYTSNSTTEAFISALSVNTGIPALSLMQGQRGGSGHSRGTWVHPLVAVNLAQWLSPEFAVGVSQLVLGWNDARAPALALPDLSATHSIEVYRVASHLESALRVPQLADAARPIFDHYRDEALTRTDLDPRLAMILATEGLPYAAVKRIEGVLERSLRATTPAIGRASV